jgi:hypothetical protein
MHNDLPALPCRGNAGQLIELRLLVADPTHRNSHGPRRRARQFFNDPQQLIGSPRLMG